MPQNRRVSMYTTNNKFGTFLDSDSQFIVPRFQRDYNWETDHVLEFWDDLYKHYNEWINKINRVPYYFGSFMLLGTLIAFFGFHSLTGERGLLMRDNLDREIAAAQEHLQLLKKENIARLYQI